MYKSVRNKQNITNLKTLVHAPPIPHDCQFERPNITKR